MTKTKWTVDTAPSRIDFAIRHMMVSNVKGTFRTFSAVFEADPANLTTANIAFTVDLASVDTGDKEHDTHLLSSVFFDINKFPQMTFLANNIVKAGEDKYDLIGEFSLHGVTRTETFSVTFKGAAKDSSGTEKVGFNATGTINPRDYELTFITPLETGGVPVGDQVDISLNIQAAQET